ncbi:uncharacterized protein LOC111066861 [Drosophila obscura]|uniref:uncharacterized protein LOC111066861 n=1 Tax=Drosophila obscura TaxID=7282 RepID=UPI001BB1A5E1|nr:uncharacterized protein LOC111066861 [Drosophila obscura]
MTLSAETLDDMFVQEVIAVAKMIVKLQAKDHIIPTCTRWLSIFQQAPPEERFERNWMLLQLHTQLNRNSTLGYPFTDPSSYHLDLRKLKERCDCRQMSHDVDDDNCESISSPDESTTSISEWVDIDARNEQLLAQNAAMNSELKELQCLEQHLQHQRDSFQKMQMETEDEEGDMQILASSATTALKLLSTNKDAKAKSQFFETLFSPLCLDEKDVAQVEKLDTLFEKLLRGRIDDYKQKQRGLMVQQASSEYDKVVTKAKERYGKVLEGQLVAQEKELALTAMRYLEVLRKHFLLSYSGNDSTMEAVLKFLQHSCHQLSKTI